MEPAHSMSPDTNPPPNRGLPLEQAFKRWGDPKIYATWLAQEDARQPVSMATGFPPNERVRRHNIYAEARKALEEQLRALLLPGTVLASGIREGDDGRSVIKPSLWKIADFCPDFDDVYANAFKFEEVEYFLATEVPVNIEELPDWLPKYGHSSTDEAQLTAEMLAMFKHSADYRRVSVGDSTFRFGALQARVIRELHAASQRGEPWCIGKNVLKDIGSSSANLGMLFKSNPAWQRLIESDEHGNYRLRLRWPSR